MSKLLSFFFRALQGCTQKKQRFQNIEKSLNVKENRRLRTLTGQLRTLSRLIQNPAPARPKYRSAFSMVTLATSGSGSRFTLATACNVLTTSAGSCRKLLKICHVVNPCPPFLKFDTSFSAFAILNPVADPVEVHQILRPPTPDL
jgi:hypothetical protein